MMTRKQAKEWDEMEIKALPWFCYRIAEAKDKSKEGALRLLLENTRIAHKLKPGIDYLSSEKRRLEAENTQLRKQLEQESVMRATIIKELAAAKKQLAEARVKVEKIQTILDIYYFRVAIEEALK